MAATRRAVTAGTANIRDAAMEGMARMEDQDMERLRTELLEVAVATQAEALTAARAAGPMVAEGLTEAVVVRTGEAGTASRVDLP